MTELWNPIAPRGRGLVTHLGTTAGFGLGGAVATAAVGEGIDWALGRTQLERNGPARIAASAAGRAAATALVVAGSSFVKDHHHRTALQAGALAGFIAPYVAWGGKMLRDWAQGAAAVGRDPYAPDSFGGRSRPMPALERAQSRRREQHALPSSSSSAVGREYLYALGADYGADAVPTESDRDFAL